MQNLGPGTTATTEEERERARKIAMEYRDMYLKEWHANATHQAEYGREADRAANAYAQSAIKSAFLLNGGGLIAVPAAVGLFDVQVDQSMAGIAAACALFIFGLILAWLTNFAAYFAMVFLGGEAWHHRDAVVKRVQINFGYRKGDIQGDRPEDDERKAALDRKTFTCFRIAGIVFGFLSFGVFVGGVVVGTSYAIDRPLVGSIFSLFD